MDRGPGTVSLVDAHIGEGPAAYNVNVRQLFVCDDNSGSFVIRLLPQGNARPKDGFTFNGPWAISGNTGTFSATATLQGFAEGSITGNLHDDGYVVHEGAQVGISWS